MLDDILLVRADVARAIEVEEWPWLDDGDAESVCAFILGLYYAAGVSIESTILLSSGVTLILSRQAASVIMDGSSHFKWPVPFASFIGDPFSFALVILQCITYAYLRIG